jgi:phage tail sheath protein FI
MANEFRFPGVYIEEQLASMAGISGIETSITAFVGNTLMGPCGVPVYISGFEDYKRIFGGLALDSMLSYAVQDFFLNGGKKALVLRLTGIGARKSRISLPCGSRAASCLNLEASSEGTWGDELSVQIVRSDLGNGLLGRLLKKKASARQFGLKIFRKQNLEEEFYEVSLNPGDAAFLPAMLEANSRLLRVLKTGSSWTLPPQNPLYTLQAVSAAGGQDGTALRTEDYLGDQAAETGIYALKKANLFNLLCIPPPQRGGDTDLAVYRAALKLCVERRAILLVDAPAAWAGSGIAGIMQADEVLGFQSADTRNAAVYFPRLLQSDALQKGQTEVFVPCGAVAGIIATTDERCGVWKAPAGAEAVLKGVKGVQQDVPESLMEILNASGINNIRNTSDKGMLLWGARTLRGSDRYADEYKYLSVRRTALYIEESVLRGTQWVIFEQNDEALWKKLGFQLEDFLMNLFRAGAFQGNRPDLAYFVKCGRDTTTQQELDNGYLNLRIGFAPLKPAEFLLINIKHKLHFP